MPAPSNDQLVTCMQAHFTGPGDLCHTDLLSFSNCWCVGLLYHLSGILLSPQGLVQDGGSGCVLQADNCLIV